MRISAVILLFLVLYNCGSSQKMKIATPKPTTSYPTTAASPKALEIVENAKKFEGVRYKYGGSDKKGMDCSGLVMTAFEKEDIRLPRSSSEMAVTGNWVDIKEVQTGDLMFFATTKGSRRITHVAIVTESRPGYVEFIHSTTSKGVVTSTLDEKYWYFAFVQARRILEETSP